MNIPVIYGSYRRDRQGIRLAEWLVRAIGEAGHSPELLDAQAIGLPMLDRMYKEYPKGEAPEAMERVAASLRGADAFLFVTGEYNWGVPPGLKNLIDHYLEEWFWRPAGIACYSAGPFGGVRAMMDLRTTLGEMGMAVISSILPVGGIGGAFDDAGAPHGDAGSRLERAFPRFLADLIWWAEAAQAQKARAAPPY